jgi:cytochrome oxidase Cu insertion factor (SCO1/SenC/PrrC family)
VESGGALARLAIALMPVFVLAGCVRALPPRPPLLTVAPVRPADWPAPSVRAAAAAPEIEALRFSSLDARVGTDWDGEVLASTNAARVELATSLFRFDAPRVAPGRFRFHFNLVDVPAQFVRDYRLRVVARTAAGAESATEVPFRISGRADALAYNADARSSDALDAPPLVDANGGNVDLAHGVTVIAFIYTRCADPKMCPLVTAKFARMAKLLAGTPVRLLEITLDPAFDTPAVLRTYASAFGADGVRWKFATGERSAIAAFAERAGLYVDRPRPGLILHTEAVLIARDGFLESNFAGNDWTPAEVAAEARAIAALPANPIARFGLRLFSGVVRACGVAFARGYSPAMLLGALLVALAATALLAALLRRMGRRRVVVEPAKS